MYRHLFVPLDDSELSVDVVGQAAALARALGARISFFHALHDDSRSLAGDAELLRLAAPEVHAWAIGGKAAELLSKAEAAARALGVPCDARHVVATKPGPAIVAAARAAGADLVVMASHGASHGGLGRLGMAMSSTTLQVMAEAGLPVLVTGSGDPAPPARAIGVIRDEHRALAAVLHAWQQALDEARRAQRAPDAALMRDCVHYLRTQPQQRHHPKEDEFVFARLRLRTHALDTELDELQRQHLRDHEWLDELDRLVQALEHAADEAAERRAAALLGEGVAAYTRFVWDHLGREEGVVLPAARAHLLDEDWQAIDEAFAGDDARFGAAAEAAERRLFSRIVNAAAR